MSRSRRPSMLPLDASSSSGGARTPPWYRHGPVLLAALALVVFAALVGSSRERSPSDVADPRASSTREVIVDAVRTHRAEANAVWAPEPALVVDVDELQCDEDDAPTVDADAPPSAPTWVAPPTPVALVGDSITFEHGEVYAAALAACGAPDAVIDARSGRMITTTDGNPFGPIPSGLAAIEMIERTVDPGVWLIELGVNDVNLGVFDEGGMQCTIKRVLELLDPDDVVFWVGTWTVGPRAHLAAEFTTSLETHDRITVLDWPAVAEELVYDGLHPTSEGARQLAAMYCDCLS